MLIFTKELGWFQIAVTAEVLSLGRNEYREIASSKKAI